MYSSFMALFKNNNISNLSNLYFKSNKSKIFRTKNQNKHLFQLHA